MHALSPARPFDGEFGRLIHREHVVAVDRDRRNPIRLGLVSQILHRELFLRGRRVGPAVVLRDHDQGDLLHRREVEPFVERACRGRAVADVDEPDARLAAQLERQRDSRHDGDHVAQVRDLTEVAALEVIEMDVQLATVRRAVGLRHVLAQNGDGLGAHHEHRAQIADQRREDVGVLAAVQSIGRPDRLPLLAEGAKQAPDHLALPVEGREPLLQRPGQPQVAIDFEQLLACEPRRNGR